jgi:chromosome segregation ATPase
MRELLFPPTLIMRALDDLSAIAGAARRLAALEADVLARMDRIEGEVLGHLDTIEAELADLEPMRRGIEPLDEDMRAVRDSVDDLEPLLEQVNTRLGALADRMETLHADLAPLGELADKIPGVGR